jgi:hypothetical protein
MLGFAIELKEKGNSAFLRGDWLGSIQNYDVSLKYAAHSSTPVSFDSIFLQIVCRSNLATAYTKLRLYEMSRICAELGNELIEKNREEFILTEQHKSSVERIQKKLFFRIQELDLEDEILDNVMRSKVVSANCPTSLCQSNELKSLFAGPTMKTWYFYEGQYKSYSSAISPSIPVRFLATIHVLTCISVFAWNRNQTSGEVKAFGAHIAIRNLLSSEYAKVSGSQKRILPELIDSMTNVFKGCDKQEVMVHVVGGHRKMDHDIALKQYHPNTPKRQRFSLRVIEILQDAGFTTLNTSLLNVFTGVEAITTREMETSLYEQNQRYVLAALDLESGSILTHSEHRSQYDLIGLQSEIRSRELEVNQRSVFNGAFVAKMEENTDPFVAL